MSHSLGFISSYHYVFITYDLANLQQNENIKEKKLQLKTVIFTKTIIAYMQPKVEALQWLLLINLDVSMGLSCCDHD